MQEVYSFLRSNSSLLRLAKYATERRSPETHKYGEEDKDNQASDRPCLLDSLEVLNGFEMATLLGPFITLQTKYNDHS